MEPVPGTDSTQILPPWCSTTFLQIARPIPVPAVLSSVVQPLKDRKYAFEIFRLYADAVVTNRKDPIVCHWLGSNMNVRRPVPTKFDGIADKVLEQLHQLDVITHHHRQRATRNHCTALFNQVLQI